MILGFAFDLSEEQGIGHAARCAALAQIAYKRGHRCLTLTNLNHWPWVKELFPTSDQFSPGQQAPDTLDWLVVDSYEEVNLFEKIQNTNFRFIAQILDEVSPVIRADMSIIPSSLSTWQVAPKNLAQTVLVGEEYLLFRKEITELREKPNPIVPGEISIVIGGTDSSNFTSKILKKVIDFPSISRINLRRDKSLQINHDKSFLPKIKFFEHPRDLHHLAKRSELVITAAGVTLWELVYLGVATASIDLVENQSAQYNYLHGEGLTFGLGGIKEMNNYAPKIEYLLSDQNKLSDLRTRSQNRLDGKGALRVIQEIESFPEIPKETVRL